VTLLAPDLEEACRRWADHPAITFRGRTITYAELWQQVSSLAGAYHHLGVRRGDRIVCQLPNSPEQILAVAAAWLVGAIHVGTDNDLTGPELAGLVDQVDARAVVFQPRPGVPDPFGALRAVAEGRPGTSLIVHHPGTSGEDAGAVPDGVHRLDLLLMAAGATPAMSQTEDREEIAVLLLTSGTTGRSKAVKESYAACWAKMQFFSDAYRPQPDDVHLVFLPMAHVFGFRLGLIALLTGGRLVLLDRFSPETALRLVTDEQVTILPGMPTHLTLLLAALDPSRHDVSTVRWVISAASQLPATVASGVYDRLGADLLYVFGCAEGFTTRTTDRAEILRGSVGRRVFRGPEGTAQDGTVTVMDPEDARPLPAGEVGELAFGARCPVEYWADPPTATDGWYHTGDLGRVDPDGCVFVVGRLKELVNRGGLKVSPSEIETAIVRHPAVLDAGVIGAPDPVLGEAICACVSLTEPPPPDQPELDLAGLRSFVALTLARHKLPDELCVVPAVPRTKIGKVDRPVLYRQVVDAGLPRQRLRPR
jgi:acyl-CoA synthetase (AMP-forming)/AMP-acid ligase II